MKHNRFEVIGESATAAFQRWQAENFGGYYLNMKSNTKARLHRVPCHHVGGAFEWDESAGDVTLNAKVCSRDEKELVDWANAKGIDIEVCQDCIKTR